MVSTRGARRAAKGAGDASAEAKAVATTGGGKGKKEPFGGIKVRRTGSEAQSCLLGYGPGLPRMLLRERSALERGRQGTARGAAAAERRAARRMIGAAGTAEAALWEERVQPGLARPAAPRAERALYAVAGAKVARALSFPTHRTP